MKNRTSIVWAFALALLAGAAAPTVSFAAPKDDAPRGPAVKQIDMLQAAADSDAVKLDAEQQTKVHKILEDATAQAQAIQQENKAKGTAGKDASKDDRKAARETVQELVTKTKQEIEGVLTEPQKKAFRAALTEERAKAKEEREGKKDDKKNDKPAH